MLRLQLVETRLDVRVIAHIHYTLSTKEWRCVPGSPSAYNVKSSKVICNDFTHAEESLGTRLGYVHTVLVGIGKESDTTFLSPLYLHVYSTQFLCTSCMYVGHMYM